MGEGTEAATTARHRLLLELGRGGMGTVYLAMTRGPAGFSKLKVVKHLRADLAAEPQFLQMFLDEARLSARLNHPNVVQTNEIGFDGKHYFIEMEYLDGQSFEAIVRRTSKGGGLPLPCSIWVLTQVLSGLHHAHELTDPATRQPLRVVHRDVSPHNVFVTYEGTVKVLDFGIAKAADSSLDTRTGVVKGKVTYMSPEQAARGRVVDRRSDVFSVGVMLWQVLAGKRLWSEHSDAEIFVKLERGDLPSPSSVSADVPEALEAICMRALAPDPSDRFQSAAALQTALEEWLEATGARVGPRQLASLVAQLFEDRRAAVSAEIEALLAVENTDRQQPVEVPSLRHSQSYAMTSTDDLHTVKTASRANGEPTEAQRVNAKQVTRDDRGRSVDPPAVPARSRTNRAIAATAIVLAIGGAAVISRKQADGDVLTAHRAMAALRPRCATHRDCSREAGEPAVCRRDVGMCVPLASVDCKVLASQADVENDATIWFGLLFPMTGPSFEGFGRANVNATDLARRDFMLIANGIPAAGPSDPPRPLGLVACDDSEDAHRAARHLVDDLGLPAVVGFFRSKEVVDLATSLFLPNGVMAVSALNLSALITSIPHPPNEPRLVWRTTISGAEWAIPVARVVSDVIEPKLVATPGLITAEKPLRVALLRTDNTSTLTAVDVLFTKLRFNGKSVLDNKDDFRQFVFDDAAFVEKVDYGPVITGLLDYRPHVIIAVTDELAHVVEDLEARWIERRYRPWYLGQSLKNEGLSRFVRTNAELRRRFLGVDLPAHTVTNVKFAAHYNDVFSPKVSPGTAPGVSYDAIYLLAYAVAALGDQPITGRNLARAVARLVPPGTPIDVGPTKIFDGLNVLRSGGNIDLHGAATSLDFDLATGETHSDFAVYCLKPTPNGEIGDPTESGAVFLAKVGRIEGALVCP